RADPSLADSVPVLALKAQLADVLAEGAPDAYARLLRTLKDVSRGSSELHQTVERRGALVAIRDRRQDLLPQFGVSGQRLLGAATSAQILNKTPLNTEATAPYVRVPAAIFEIGTPQTNALKAFAARPDLQPLALAVSDVPPGLLTPLLTTYKQHPFSDRTLKLLGRYGRVLETGAEGLVMPGGPPAEQVWRRFIGVAPGNQRLT